MGYSQGSAGLVCTGLKQKRFWGEKSQFGQAESDEQSMSLQRISRAGTQLPQQWLGADPGSQPPTEGHSQAVPRGISCSCSSLPAQPLPCDLISSDHLSGVSVPLLLGTARQEFPSVQSVLGTEEQE